MGFSGNEGLAIGFATHIFGVTTLLERTLTVYEKNGNDWVYVSSTSGSSTRSIALELSFTGESGVEYKTV